MPGLSIAALQIDHGAWSFALAALGLLLSSLTGAYVARLRQKVLIKRDETDRLVRLGEVANKRIELNILGRMVDLGRLNLENERKALVVQERLSAAALQSEVTASAKVQTVEKRAA